MLIRGEWFLCPDGETRPVVPTNVPDSGGVLLHRRFLLDTGADRTVLSAALLIDLGLPSSPPAVGLALQGVGGMGAFVLVTTRLEFARADGGVARVQGQFAAFTNPHATDMSILGRDVLDNFDVIISRRPNEVLLLAGNHSCTVTSP